MAPCDWLDFEEARHFEKVELLPLSASLLRRIGCTAPTSLSLGSGIACRVRFVCMNDSCSVSVAVSSFFAARSWRSSSSPESSCSSSNSRAFLLGRQDLPSTHGVGLIL